jgi:hypothetical protein
MLSPGSQEREIRILVVGLEKDRKIRVGVPPKDEECLVLFAARADDSAKRHLSIRRELH